MVQEKARRKQGDVITTAVVSLGISELTSQDRP